MSKNPLKFALRPLKAVSGKLRNHREEEKATPLGGRVRETTPVVKAANEVVEAANETDPSAYDISQEKSESEGEKSELEEEVEFELEASEEDEDKEQEIENSSASKLETADLAGQQKEESTLERAQEEVTAIIDNVSITVVENNSNSAEAEAEELTWTFPFDIKPAEPVTSKPGTPTQTGAEAEAEAESEQDSPTHGKSSAEEHSSPEGSKKEKKVRFSDIREEEEPSEGQSDLQSKTSDDNNTPPEPETSHDAVSEEDAKGNATSQSPKQWLIKALTARTAKETVAAIRTFVDALRHKDTSQHNDNLPDGNIAAKVTAHPTFSDNESSYESEADEPENATSQPTKSQYLKDILTNPTARGTFEAARSFVSALRHKESGNSLER